VRGRSKLAYVFPWLPRKFPTFESYSTATVADIFPADHLAKARRYAATELASGVYFQGADGTFEFKPLPSIAQISPINGIVVGDLEGRGAPDVYCVGNNYGPEPSTGRFDGGVGILLRGDGHGGLAPVPTWQSGLLAPGDTRSALAVSVGKGISAIAVTQCNGPVLLFSRNQNQTPTSQPIAQR
jgi:hypothetical protein